MSNKQEKCQFGQILHIVVFLHVGQELSCNATIFRTAYKGLVWYSNWTQICIPPHPRFITTGSLSPVDILVTQAAQDQHQIGWDQFLHGWLSKLWTNAYSCVQHLTGLPASPEHWTKAIIQQLWKVSFHLWTYRNGVIHGHNQDDQLCLQSEQHQTQIHSYFMQCNQDPTIVLAKDRHLFQRISMTWWLSQDIDPLLSWINSVTLVIDSQHRWCLTLHASANCLFAPFHWTSYAEHPPPG